jgi:hypothetical protein
MPPFLYRGVSEEMHVRLGGRLEPKNNKPFVRSPEFGRAEWNNSFWGENEANAVIEHQQHQAGYPTSGVSTTPHRERAAFYATAGRTRLTGYIYVVDRALLSEHGIRAYVVNDIVPSPSVPEDDEVILVGNDYGPLASAVIVEVVRCDT